MMTFRAEKTTRNKDDFRVLVAGIFIAIMLTALKPYVLMYLHPELSTMCEMFEKKWW